MHLLFTILLSLSTLCADSGILNISWPSPNPKQEKPSKAYPSLLTEGIKETKLPIYIPNNYVYDEKMIVVADENFYSINFLLKDATFMVSGDRTYQESVSADDVEFKTIAENVSKVEFVHAEGMMTTDFNRHGINYSILVECDKPKTDKRCNDEAFIKELYNRLIMVGGKR